MAPPPLSALLDWRVPYVPLLAMIWVSEVGAAEALEPGLRLPRIRFLPSPDATANDEASRPMITADESTSVVFELVRRNLRNMGGDPPCGFPFPPQLGRGVKVAVGCQRLLPCNGCCR